MNEKKIVDKPTEEEKLRDLLLTQFTAIDILHKRQLILPVLTLSYSTIDIFGYYWAGGNDNEAGKRFKGFVEKYIIKYLEEVNAYDLWGARCAILHTATPESTISKKDGGARIILYSYGLNKVEMLKKMIAKNVAPHKYVAIAVEDLLEAIEKGINDFFADLKNDKIFCNDCMERARNIYATIHLPW